MKEITPQQIENVIEHIIHDKEESNKVKKMPFVGVSQDELFNELGNRLGKGWVAKKELPVKFTKADISAVANNRFYRKTGIKMLMAWALIIMAFALATLTYHVIPLFLYYGISIVVTVIIILLYSRKQKVVREELKRAVYGSDKVITDRD